MPTRKALLTPVVVTVVVVVVVDRKGKEKGNDGEAVDCGGGKEWKGWRKDNGGEPE
jgi:hypothetical protein